MAVFVPIFLFISILTKQKTWMSVVGSCAIGMLLFMMIPLNATIMNPILCLAGGALFSVGLGALGTFALGKSDLV